MVTTMRPGPMSDKELAVQTFYGVALIGMSCAAIWALGFVVGLLR
jgi:hypothetical protein